MLSCRLYFWVYPRLKEWNGAFSNIFGRGGKTWFRGECRKRDVFSPITISGFRAGLIAGLLHSSHSI